MIVKMVSLVHGGLLTLTQMVELVGGVKVTQEVVAPPCHRYSVPPLAQRVVEFPWQISVAPVIVTVGVVQGGSFISDCALKKSGMEIKNKNRKMKYGFINFIRV